MKAVKIFYNGVQLRDVYPHANRWQVIKFKTVRGIGKLLRLTAISTVATGLMLVAYFYGTFDGRVVSAVNIITQETSFPILDKIAMAESHGSQICTSEIASNGWCKKYEIGAPLIHVNTNGTYDIGKYQINSIHLANAIALGYNLYLEKDNEAFARYLFTTQGSEPWSASKHNWK